MALEGVRVDLRRVAGEDGDDVLERGGVIVDRLDGEDAAALLGQRLLDQAALLPD